MENDDGSKVMPKNYVEELAKWVKKHEALRPRKNKNLVAFLSVRADVKAAIGAGYAFKTIWEHLFETEKISYRYETFLRHVRRHITQSPTNQVKGSNPEQKAWAVKQDGSPKPQKNDPPAPIGGFTFNPIPRKEDLF